MERLVQHAIQAVTVAAIIGGFAILSDLQSSNAVIRSEIATLKGRFDAFTADRYTSREARRDNELYQSKLLDHEARLRELERVIARTGN